MRFARIAPVLIALGISAALLIALFPVGQSQQATAVAPTNIQSANAAEHIAAAQRASRSLIRTPAPKKKTVVRKVAKPKPVVHRTIHRTVHKRVYKSVAVPGTKGAAQRYARGLVPAGQWGCLRDLWNHESGWSTTNSYGSAYGIPQALPGSKMSSYGSDWRTNYKTQIKWGLHYIDGRYGSPCSAWAHFQSHNWY